MALFNDRARCIVLDCKALRNMAGAGIVLEQVSNTGSMMGSSAVDEAVSKYPSSTAATSKLASAVSPEPSSALPPVAACPSK
eukprot:CAMPEP_0172601818 /NCGR_PEP_ID=MMETSP1068-20121228/21995_1 /TAXON_ID=35684 /ORGANISM="Pseudopedinella elastica, Strain CCMP716" /LENGTH=81 /DNA_ID=CAMNT_0013402955 /DNA_START=378 /DNA_END=624 /DNA_ORIENTATION=+